MAPEFKIAGLSQLMAQLKAAPDRLQQRVLIGAVAEAGAVIRDEAIVRAPYYSGKVGPNHPPPGTLKKSIYQYRIRNEGPGIVAWLVTVRRGKNARDKDGASLDAFYATWVEYGTVKMTARPYMRPAFEAKKGEAVNAMRDFVARNLPKLVEL